MFFSVRQATVVACLVACGPAALEAQQQNQAATAAARAATAVRSLGALRVETGPAIDGRLNEAAWARADVASQFVQFQPAPGTAPTQRTEVRVLYDDDALYVGARLFDTAPDSIVARLARRDDAVFSDWFHVIIDSYYDRRTAFSFGVNPRGVKVDAQYSQDTNEDNGWDAVWDVAVRVDSLGWVAEFRIPLSQLRFSANEGAQAWGVNFRRAIARYDEVTDWAPIPAGGAEYVSRAGDLVGLQGLKPRRRLEIQPYTVAGLTREPGDAADPFHSSNRMTTNVGADVRYGLTSDLTLSLTLNPDFGQVEADPSVVNLSGFEDFFPERRPFFLEGAEIFQPTFPFFPRVVHTRRIGRAPQGGAPGSADFAAVPEATTILGAAKLTGKTADGWSIGLFDAVTAREDARYLTAGGLEETRTAEPLTNYAVGRVARDLGGGQSAVGLIATATNRSLPVEGHLDFLTTSGYLLGVDGRHRFGRGWEVQGSVFGTRVEGAAAAIDRIQTSPVHRFNRPDADYVTYDPTRTSLMGWSANANLQKRRGHWRMYAEALVRSPGLELNDLGFLGRADRIQTWGSVAYNQFNPGPLFRNWRINLGAWRNQNFGGQRSWTGINTWGGVQFHNQWAVDAWTWYDLGRLNDDELRGGPALYGDPQWGQGMDVTTDRRKAVSLSVGVNHNRAYGRDFSFLNLNADVTVRPSQRMDLTLGPRYNARTEAAQFVRNVTVDGEPRYLRGRLEQTTVSLTARLSYTFTPDLSLQVYAQPFVSAGAYGDFLEVNDPAATDFAERFTPLAGRVTFDETAGRYAVDFDADGTSDATFGNPDFNFRQFRSNVVLRWEYRPGSTVFVVWARGQTDFTDEGRLRFGRDVSELFGADATDRFLVKFSYWIGR